MRGFKKQSTGVGRQVPRGSNTRWSNARSSSVEGDWWVEAGVGKKKGRTRKKQDERMKLRSQKDERSLEHSRVITRLLWNSSRSLKLEDDALSGCCSGGPVIPTENSRRDNFRGRTAATPAGILHIFLTSALGLHALQIFKWLR